MSNNNSHKNIKNTQDFVDIFAWANPDDLNHASIDQSFENPSQTTTNKNDFETPEPSQSQKCGKCGKIHPQNHSNTNQEHFEAPNEKSNNKATKNQNTGEILKMVLPLLLNNNSLSNNNENSGFDIGSILGMLGQSNNSPPPSGLESLGGMSGILSLLGMFNNNKNTTKKSADIKCASKSDIVDLDDYQRVR